MAVANLRRTIAAALGVLAFFMLPSPRPLMSQVGDADSGTMQKLYRRYAEQAVSHPDSGLITLHTILDESSATSADTTSVAEYAVTEGIVFLQRFDIALNGRFTRTDAQLDTLTFKNLQTHADSLDIAISYVSLSDTTRPNSGTANLLSRFYFERALTRVVVARRIDRCSDWRGVLDDALRAMRYTDRAVPPRATFELLPPYQRTPPPSATPMSLAGYAVSMVNARCGQPTPR